jgi:signal transduction histidine kinase
LFKEGALVVHRKRGLSGGFRWPVRLALALAAGLAIFATTQPIYLENLGLRAAAETMITMSAVVGAVLLFLRFRRTRRVRDVMLLGALVTVALADFPSSVLPALVGLDEMEPTTFANVVAQTLVALAFAGAALTPAAKRIQWRGRAMALAGISGTLLIALAQLTTFLARNESLASVPTGFSAAMDRPALLATRLAAITMLALAAAVFLRSRDRHDDPHLLAAAAFFLAGSRLQYLVLPTIAPAWVTPGLGLRAAAYGLMLVFAVRQHARTRQAAAAAALRAERERISRDLHDGIAQDLAFIAAHRHRLVTEFGAEHPIVVAARRALAASRGAMVDLAASAAPTTAMALTDVAQEVEARFGVEITVNVGTSDDVDLGVAERDEIVRIAREAMVNAVKHGRAKKIVVELGSKKGNILLRVRDDGCGIPAEVAVKRDDLGGFGLPTMRARAASLGGRLVTGRGSNGGSEVKVVLS